MNFTGLAHAGYVQPGGREEGEANIRRQILLTPQARKDLVLPLGCQLPQYGHHPPSLSLPSVSEDLDGAVCCLTVSQKAQGSA